MKKKWERTGLNGYGGTTGGETGDKGEKTLKVGVEGMRDVVNGEGWYSLDSRSY